MTFLSSLIEVDFEGANIGKKEGFWSVMFSREGAKTQRKGLSEGDVFFTRRCKDAKRSYLFIKEGIEMKSLLQIKYVLH